MTEATVAIPASSLRATIGGILRGLGVAPEEATTVADLLVEADLRGVESHGAHLVSLYVSRIRSGHLRPSTTITTLRDDGTTVLLDGGLGFGQVAGLEAMQLAVDRSGEHGVAAVAVRESTHLGALGAFTMRAAQAGRICFCWQNGPTIVPPFGGVTPLFSTNPISYGIPTADEPTIVYDIATTTVAGNKVLLAKRRGDPTIPEGWANDERGRPTTDTEAASVFNLQWFGGHKGFGLGFLVEVLAGVLTGSSFSRLEYTESELAGKERISKGYLFIALDPARFMPIDEFRARVDALVRDVRESERAEGVERIWMPGEIEHYRRIDRERDGVPLPHVLVDDLNGFAAELGAPALVEGSPT
jgi:LDH2 family malate/lactate/ureidoglycolate dehydrogenase